MSAAKEKQPPVANDLTRDKPDVATDKTERAILTNDDLNSVPSPKRAKYAERPNEQTVIDGRPAIGVATPPTSSLTPSKKVHSNEVVKNEGTTVNDERKLKMEPSEGK